MGIKKSLFARYVRNFQLRELFNDMGWNNDRTRHPIVIKDSTFLITGLAEKGGFRILACEPVEETKMPDKVMRKRIEREVTKLFQEHIIVFYDKSRRSQIWQLAVRKSGSPVKISEVIYNISQDPELLYQKASRLFFSLDEEEKITIVDVTKRVSENFQKNNEIVTKKFYEKFKKEHTAFLKFISGIDDRVSRDWYASLMLNRLMFCYFIQKQRFLDNNPDYLQEKLKECKEKKGKNKFYSFYRDFLLALFHKGLGSPNHDKTVEIELGRIPYLNGGLFDVHVLEKTFSDIQIDDKAFQKLFEFFDEWNWHLDTRETASGKDINPDVIGYIFEKYINDRAQMGAYYTKEDITDYISKNCIIPWLFDEVKRNYPKAFAADGWLWRKVKNSGTDYIYNAVKYGIPEDGGLFDDLPPEVKKGFVPELEDKIVDGKGPYLWEMRKDWNKAAPSEIALPTEIYREVIERRKRYARIKSKIEAGEIAQINDFITYNLNIRQFAQDVIEDTEDPDFLRHFYKALTSVTILDPTCGSGAFLFAAMNILEPLYETCIERMVEFTTAAVPQVEADKKKVSEPQIEPDLNDLADRVGVSEPRVEADLPTSTSYIQIRSGSADRSFKREPRQSNKKQVNQTNQKNQWFRRVLKLVNAPEHPNRQYFIYKSIILNNLYGVDIMNEAVEIAKLRLFLKLMATVEADYRKPNIGLEPLPDVDFNIRSGNTLVGYANEKQLMDSLTYDAQGYPRTNAEERLKIYKEKCDIVARAFERYKEIQLTGGDDYKAFRKAKDELNARLKKLTDELDEMLYVEQYGGGIKGKKIFQEWLAKHKPFHWFAEFYEIVQGKNGFDVVIGNPPYVELKKINYNLISYSTKGCGNLYALVVERNKYLMNKKCRSGMIIPHSSICTDRMSSLIEHLTKYGLWLSSFDIRPSKLFDGVDQRLLIYLTCHYCANLFTSRYHRWTSDCRNALFENVEYIKDIKTEMPNSIIKASKIIEKFIHSKIISHSKISLKYSSNGTNVYYHNAPRYFIRVVPKPPYFWNEKDGKKISTHVKCLKFSRKDEAHSIAAVLNSNLFYWWFVMFSDSRDLNSREIDNFRFNLPKGNLSLLTDVFTKLNISYESNKHRKETYYKSTGKVIYDEYYPKLSKPIIDEIDSLIATYYGFTHAELDFIINYDIKYRMGKELNSEED